MDESSGIELAWKESYCVNAEPKFIRKESCCVNAELKLD